MKIAQEIRAGNVIMNGKAVPQTGVGGPTRLPADLPAWQAAAVAARTRLLRQDDLSTRLLGFVTKKR